MGEGQVDSLLVTWPIAGEVSTIVEILQGTKLISVTVMVGMSRHPSPCGPAAAFVALIWEVSKIPHSNLKNCTLGRSLLQRTL
jgi:hypothetical protein